MKKYIVIILVSILAAAGVLISRNRARTGAAKVIVKAGSSSRDFIIGMKNESIYNLRDFLGRYMVILSFTDNGVASVKFDKLLRRKINVFKKYNMIWLNIKKDGRHAIIEEMTSRLGLKYKTLYENIPSFYSFANSPAVILIDKHGIIRLVYSGYSPTVVDDVKNRIAGY